MRAIRASFAGLVLGGSVLGGCVSTVGLLDMAPTEQYRSKRSQNEVAFCLADKNMTSVLERVGGEEVIMTKNGFGAVAVAFSVYPEGQGSRVEYRRAPGGIGGVWKQCLGDFETL